jgi:hypothetical protein
MKLAATIGIALLLAACATPPPEIPGPASAPAEASAPVVRSRAAQLLAAAGQTNAPTRAEIERALGPADIARQDGAGAALTYRFEHCALLLLFVGEAPHLAQAHASPRRAGEGAPSLDSCAAEAAAR